MATGVNAFERIDIPLRTDSSEDQPAVVQLDGPEDLLVIPGNPPPEGARVIWYKGRSGRRLRLLFAPEPRSGQKCRGTVLVCPGWTEFIEKYFEVARELQAKGFAVAVFDWPGQGRSERFLKNPELGHVHHFAEYVEALRRGVQELGSKAPKPHVILAHSMGGAISLEALRSKRIEAKAAAFSAPMWGLPLWFYLRWIVHIARFFGFGASGLKRNEDRSFAANNVTNDPDRWRRQEDLLAADPRLRITSPTIAWVASSLNAIRIFFEPNGLGAARKLPVLVAIADKELVVRSSAQRRLSRRFKNADVLEVKGAKHEILMETDERRQKFWAAFEKLLQRADI